MTKQKQQRLIAIKRMMVNYGIVIDNVCYISLFELAYNLNNCWYARDFFQRSTVERNNKIDQTWNEDFSLRDHYLHDYFRPIRDAIKDTQFHIEESEKNGTEYIKAQIQ